MPHDMPLKPTTVRFAEDGMEIIQAAADRVGSQFSQFVREAALMRAVIVLGEEQALAKLNTEVERIRKEGNGERAAEEIKRLARRDD